MHFVNFARKLGAKKLGAMSTFLLALVAGAMAINCGHRTASETVEVEKVARTQSADTVNTFSSQVGGDQPNSFASGAALNGRRVIVYPDSQNGNVVNVVSSPTPPAAAIPGADGGPDALASPGPGNGLDSPTSLVDWSTHFQMGDDRVCGGGSCGGNLSVERGSVVIAAFNNKLFYAFDDTNEVINVRSSNDGTDWTTDPLQVLNQTKTNGGPALAAFTDPTTGVQQLVLAYAGTDHQLNVLSSTTGDFTNAAVTTIGQHTPHAPSLASFTGKLFIGWAGESNSVPPNSQINWAQIVNLSQTPTLQNLVTLNSPQATGDGVGLLGFGDKFIVSWVGSGNPQINYVALSPSDVASMQGNTSLPSDATQVVVQQPFAGFNTTQFTPTFANFGPMPALPAQGDPPWQAPTQAALLYVNKNDGALYVHENVFFLALGCTVSGGRSFDTADWDNDGILNCWETDGIDVNGDGVVDLPLNKMGANPTKPDIFLEVDFFDCTVLGSDCGNLDAGAVPDGGDAGDAAPIPDTHNHRPQTASLQAIISAFANAPLIGDPDAGLSGINLHIGGVPDPTLDGGTQPGVMEGLPHQQFCDMHAQKNDAGLPECYFNFKRQMNEPGFGSNFGDPSDRSSPNAFNILTAKKLFYHYTLFAHQMTIGGPDNPVNGNDGVSGICSPDTLIALKDTYGPGAVAAEATTLMHELGHDLNLRHGGNENTNNKPNYLSVMNYSFSGGGIPIFSGTPTGSILPRSGGGSALLDYSRFTLQQLDETALNETKGVLDDLTGGFVDTNYMCPNGTFVLAPANGAPIDWDCDDAGPQASVTQDINGDRFCVGIGLPAPDAGDAAVAYLQTDTTKLGGDDKVMGGMIVPLDGSALKTSPDYDAGDQVTCPMLLGDAGDAGMINCKITPNKQTNILNSAARLQAPDRIIGTAQIFDGNNRICETTAMPGTDVQLRDAGTVEENPLFGFNDWANLQFSFRSSFCPANTSAGDSSELIADLEQQAVQQQVAALGVADLGIQGSPAFVTPHTSTTVTLTYTVTNAGPNGTVTPSIDIAVPSDFTVVSCAGGPCQQVGGVVVVPVPSLAAGTNVTIPIVVSAGSGVTTGTSLTAVAQVFDQPADPNLANNVSSITVAPPPSLFGSSLSAWYRLDQGVTVDSSGNVQQLADFGASASHGLAQSAASQRPHFNASDPAFLNMPSMTFSATSVQTLATSAFLTQPFSVFAAYNVSGAGRYKDLLNDDVQSCQIDFVGPSNKPYLYSGVTLGDTVTVPTGADALLAVFSGATSSAIYSNSSSGPVNTGPVGSAAHGATMGIGGVSTLTSQTFDGSVAELFIVSGVPTSSQISQVFTYFAARYGIATPPSLFGSSLLAWYRLDQGVTGDSAGNVQQLADFGVSGSHGLTQTNAAQRPHYNASDPAFANRPSMTFSATSVQNLATSAFLTQPFTVFAAYNVSGAGRYKDLLNDDVQSCQIDLAGNKPYIYAGVTLGDTVAVPTGADALCAVFNGASSAIYSNSSSTPINSGPAGSAAHGTTMGIGGVSTLTNQTFDGSVAELFIVSGVPTASQIAQVYAYFAARYGMAAQ